MKHVKTQAVFKPYSPNQLNLLPPSLNQLIEANHPVRVVNSVVDKLETRKMMQSPLTDCQDFVSKKDLNKVKSVPSYDEST